MLSGVVHFVYFLSAWQNCQHWQSKTIMHAVVNMVLCVTGTFRPWLIVTIKMCVAVGWKNKKQNGKWNECVALQDVSLQRVSHRSSSASSSSHIPTRLLSLCPLFFPRWKLIANRPEVTVRLSSARLSAEWHFLDKFNKLQICVHVYIRLAQMSAHRRGAWLTRRSDGKCHEMCLFRFWGGRGELVGDGVRLIQCAGLVFWQPPPTSSARMLCTLTVTFTGLFSQQIALQFTRVSQQLLSLWMKHG